MNTRILAAVVAAASFVSASAFADARYNDNAADLPVASQSQLTRAQVRSELAQASANGQLAQVETGAPLVAASQAQKAVASNTLTRASVRAQLAERSRIDQDSRS